MMRTHIVSLFDRTGYALMPWAEVGYNCFAYDLKNDDREEGRVEYKRWDANSDPELERLLEQHMGQTHMVCGFPPCTDLAGSGAKHWMKKSIKDPDFQRRAMDFVFLVSHIGEQIANIWWLENPVGAIPTYWRDANFWFDPFEFAGYLPANDRHPKFPNNIPPQDRYSKRTGIWCSPNFIIPPSLPLDPFKSNEGSPLWAELGGDSEKTKHIRSATPRGWARAVFEYNRGDL